MSFICKKLVINLIQINVKQQVRYYARWTHRRPVKVIPAEKYQNLEDDNYSNISKFPRTTVKDGHKIINMEDVDLISNIPEDIVKEKVKPTKKHVNVKKVKVTDMLQTIIDADGNVVYTKMQNKDFRIGNLLTTIKSKKLKSKKDMILLEGKRLIKEALINNCRLEYLIFTRSNELDYLKSYLPKSGSHIYKMPYREMQMWSDLTTTPGIMGIFRTPNLADYDAKNAIPLTIICDNIREPGNLGAVIRACAGAGCEKLILTKGCVNVWDSKVTRSSAGAHFNLQIHIKQNWLEIANKIDANSQVFIADNKIVNYNESDSSNMSEVEMTHFLNAIPILPYYGTKYSPTKPIVLIIGGETEGIGIEAYKFTANHNGFRLNIPLQNNVNSLNTGTALGIIIFEMKKQFLKNNINEIDSVNVICPQVL